MRRPRSLTLGLKIQNKTEPESLLTGVCITKHTRFSEEAERQHSINDRLNVTTYLRSRLQPAGYTFIEFS